MTVGKKIQLVRKHRKMTQKELGIRIGLGENGANRVAQYEMGYRVPKEDLLEAIAAALDVPVENFLMKDTYLQDVLRTLLWFDWEHPTEFRLTITDAEEASEDMSEVRLTGNAKVRMDGGTYQPATVLWSKGAATDVLMREWAIRKQELESHQITKDEYLEWLLQWPASADLAGLREPRRLWRKDEYGKGETNESVEN